MAEKMSFEEALARLEEIVDQLEKDHLSLDNALATFEEGISLVKLCGRRLQQAEKKTQRLSKLSLEIIEPADTKDGETSQCRGVDEDGEHPGLPARKGHSDR
jgi:exodeoxyribonuclease VII small subunit